MRPATIAVLSTYPPTQCGLATFSAALRDQLDQPRGTVGIVRVVNEAEPTPAAEVVTHLVNGSRASAAAAVARLNSFDAVLIQHEYGIYGGPDGVDVLDLIDGLTVPSIVVLHTVRQHPSPRQRLIVTMTDTARGRLLEGYGADPSQVVVIPHGAIDHGSVTAHSRGRARPLILTWGLLGPGKGIEWAIDALAGLRDLSPRYLVLGKTHPKVLEHEGEAYRDLVEFVDSYLAVADLAALVASANVVLLPYDSDDQVTSGVLVEAIAAGRPVVSTAFPHAIELLTGGPGLVVPQRDPVGLEGALRRVLSEPGLADRMTLQARQRAPQLFWEAVAGRYRQVAETLVATAVAEAS
jgi:glycosyltransferase involved in cell wall biosynthesis